MICVFQNYFPCEINMFLLARRSTHCKSNEILIVYLARDHIDFAFVCNFLQELLAQFVWTLFNDKTIWLKAQRFCTIGRAVFTLSLKQTKPIVTSPTISNRSSVITRDSKCLARSICFD